MLRHQCFLQDVSDQYSLRYPSLYNPGQQNLLFNRRRFLLCALQGLATSCLLFFIPYGAFAAMEREDGTHISDQQTFAVTVATSLILVVSVEVRNALKGPIYSSSKCAYGARLWHQIGLEKHYWTAINQLFLWGSLTAYFAILFAMHSDGMFAVNQSHFPFVGKSGR